MHFRSLNEIGQLPYAYDDLIQLHRYFYSVDSDEDGSAGGGRDECGMPPPSAPGGIHVNTSPPKSSGLQRKISYRGLNDMLAKQQGDGGNSSLYQPSLNFAPAENSSSKRNLRQMAEDLSMQPANKRSRGNDKPRIDYFPRIKVRVAKVKHLLNMCNGADIISSETFEGQNRDVPFVVQADQGAHPSSAAQIRRDDHVPCGQSLLRPFLKGGPGRPGVYRRRSRANRHALIPPEGVIQGNNHVH